MKPVSKAQYDKIRKIPDTPAGHRTMYKALVLTKGINVRFHSIMD